MPWYRFLISNEGRGNLEWKGERAIFAFHICIWIFDKLSKHKLMSRKKIALCTTFGIYKSRHTTKPERNRLMYFWALGWRGPPLCSSSGKEIPTLLSHNYPLVRVWGYTEGWKRWVGEQLQEPVLGPAPRMCVSWLRQNSYRQSWHYFVFKNFQEDQGNDRAARSPLWAWLHGTVIARGIWSQEIGKMSKISQRQSNFPTNTTTADRPRGHNGMLRVTCLMWKNLQHSLNGIFLSSKVPFYRFKTDLSPTLGCSP